MRLLSLDYDPVYGDDNFIREAFDSDVSVFDFDTVIWDPAGAISHYYGIYGERYKNLPCLSDHESVRLVADIDRRRTEFADFLLAGRTLIVIIRPPQQCYVATGEKQYSGTGRNRSATRMVTDIDIWKALPLSKDNLSLALASGNRIQTVGSDSLSNFLKSRRSFFKYDAVMTKSPGTTVAKVHGTERAVGSFLKTQDGGGLLVLLPAPDLVKRISDATGKPIFKAEAKAIQDELLSAVAGLSSGGTVARPAWAESYTTNAQSDIREAIVEQQARVESARARLATLQKEKEQSESRDQLFLGTGRPLELEVKAVFEQLGCDVTEPEQGRDDWKVTFSDRNAVVEVKGVSKSAAEKHAAQLEKWVAGEMEETGISPKGILVVNTWRETELSDRTASDFPDQMLPYCIGREHCLITGLQLFVIRQEIEVDPTKAEYWRTKILETNGTLEGATDWQSILIRSDSDDSQK